MDLSICFPPFLKTSMGWGLAEEGGSWILGRVGLETYGTDSLCILSLLYFLDQHAFPKVRTGFSQTMSQKKKKKKLYSLKLILLHILFMETRKVMQV